MFTQQQLALRLRHLQKARGYTQQQLASVLKIHRSTYSYYETGKTQPSLESLCLLSRFYGLPLAQFLGSAL